MSCPICGKAVDPAQRPFCSRRCADVDLARWFGEGYRIPAGPTDEGQAIENTSEEEISNNVQERGN